MATAMKWRERGGEVGSDAKTILEVVGEEGREGATVSQSGAQSRSDDAGRRLLEARREGRGYGGIGGGGVKALLQTYVLAHWKNV